MKKLLGGLGLLTLMAFFVFAGPSQAASATKKITITPKHRIMFQRSNAHRNGF